MTSGNFLSVTSSVTVSCCFGNIEGLRGLTNREGVLVVSVADFTSQVLGVRSSVDQALSIVNIAILMSTANIMSTCKSFEYF
jgi:hypothetical protein